MPEPSTLLVFAAASVALLLVPGPAVLYIVARSIDQGRRAGLASVAGIHVGSLVHVAAAAVGLSAILTASATAFTIVKYAGAVYLVFLGIRKFLERDTFDEAHGAERSIGRVFRQGIVVNVLNPKTAVFFLAFLPQFVDPARGAAAAQTAVLGLTFIGLGLFTDSGYALAASAARGVLRRSRRFAKAQRYTAGTVFVGLGVTAAVTGSRPNS